MGAGFAITVLLVGLLLGLIGRNTVNQDLDETDESNTEQT